MKILTDQGIHNNTPQITKSLIQKITKNLIYP